MTDLEFKQLRQEHESNAEAAAEARGTLKGLQKRLLDEFGLKTVEAAKAKLKQLKASKEELEGEVDAAVEAYKEQYQSEA